MDNDNEKAVFRAAITPSDEEGYDFSCTAVPVDNKQIKRSTKNNEYFLQVLRTARENVVSDRLEAGLPLYDNHPEDQGALNVLGISVGYDFTEAGIVMRMKFGARADEALKNDVKNGVVKHVSIEGSVLDYGKIERQMGQLPIYYATTWEPESLSFATIPQDLGAKIDVKRALDAQLHKKENYFDLLTKNMNK